MMCLRISVAFSLAPCLFAQGVVSPQHFASACGPISDVAPLGDTQIPYRFLQVHDDLTGRPMTIRSLTFRRDEAQTYDLDGYAVMVSAFLSSAATNAATVSATFDANHGPNKVQCAQFKVVQFPATGFGAAPRPFEYRVPLDTPFVWNGTGSLCWEFQVTSRTNTLSYAFDAAQGASTSPPLTVVGLGTGCQATVHGGYPLTVYGSGSTDWPNATATVMYQGYYMPPNSVALFMLGTSNTSFFGVPLPFEIPGTRGAPSGTCYLLNSMALMVPFLTDQNGYTYAVLGMPATPDLHGGRVFAQALAVDLVANPTGVVSSNMVQHHWVAPYAMTPLSKVELAGAGGGTGTVTLNTGLVVRFE